MELVKVLSRELDLWHGLQTASYPRVSKATRDETQRMCRIVGHMLLDAMRWAGL